MLNNQAQSALEELKLAEPLRDFVSQAGVEAGISQLN
jgi:hypothetical protein